MNDAHFLFDIFTLIGSLERNKTFTEALAELMYVNEGCEVMS